VFKPNRYVGQAASRRGKQSWALSAAAFSGLLLLVSSGALNTLQIIAGCVLACALAIAAGAGISYYGLNENPWPGQVKFATVRKIIRAADVFRYTGAGMTYVGYALVLLNLHWVVLAAFAAVTVVIVVVFVYVVALPQALDNRF
jgi:hypothetical protein